MSARAIYAYGFYRIQNREQGFVFSQKILISLALFSFNQSHAALRRRFQYFYSLNRTVDLGRRDLSCATSLNDRLDALKNRLALLRDGDNVNVVNGVAEEQWRLIKRRHQVLHLLRRLLILAFFKRQKGAGE